ncbi:MAG: hypothetical protein JG782_1928 [Anaerophaga sp.]|jgi:hypothetical protein|uniref:hypothetical protein n=1 Tax=Anaerophaga thermohalophila TaxID=177400 RepID=UPI000237D579|nr:hypothetical protein [Anaerophaga thermohalophila]MBZ4677308.1 hypothetical protein [Anaerophaga sp.]MDI3520726.1 hypothetical protein [Anaerophaga sp.]MDK2842572.1 hypothetical protein [Anaerophaga sp.]MDN5291061.1 hypothetical protein [Anaerophaga sp.]
MPKSFFYILIGFVLLLAGCKKDELTLPAEVDMQFLLNPYYADAEFDDEEKKEADEDNSDNNPFSESDGIVADDGTSQNIPGNKIQIESLEINRGKIVLTDIEIEGIREQGEDVYLAIPFEPPLQIDMKEGIASDQHISFDLPQGIYEKLEFRFFLGGEKQTAIQFQGNIKAGNSAKAGFNFRYIKQEDFQVRAMRKNHRPTENIIINKDKTTKASMIIDAENLFSALLIPPFFLSVPGSYDAGNEITISNLNKKNKAIFGLMQGRLEKSVSVVFE